MAHKRIDQLPQSSGPKPYFYVAIRNMDNNITERLELSHFMTSTTTQNFEWDNEEEYLAGDVVTYGGFWWQAELDNDGVTPGTDEDIWTQLSRSASGFVQWQEGVFVEDEVYVLHELDEFVQIFRLASETRPYVSSSFLSEYAQGDWELMSERGYIGISKTTHGFAVNDVLTYKSGNWNKFTAGDTPLAIVREVVSANLVIVVLLGNRLKGLSGLTPGSLYYAQSDATISTVESDNVIFLAVSATEAILLAAGGSSSQDQYVVDDIPDRNTLASGWGVDETGWFVHVVNAYKDHPSAGQGDSTVNTNPSYAGYIWDGSVFKKIYEFEGLDIAFNKFSVVTSNITGSVTIDLSTGNMFILTLTGNVTSFSFSNEEVGREYVFIFLKDTSEKTLTWASGKYRFPFGNAPVLTNPTTNGTSGPARSVDIMTGLCHSSGRLSIVQSPDLIEN